MKLLSFLLIWGSLAIGVAAASTAYLPTLDMLASAPEPLTLSSPAGATEVPSAKDPNVLERVPLVAPVGPDGAPTRLTPEVVAVLREAGVERVRVKEFAFERWSTRWIFVGACLGLLAGSMLVRLEARRCAAAATAAAGPGGTPETALRSMIERAASIRAAAAGRGADQAAACAAIVSGVDALNAAEVSTFVDARPLIIGRIGFGRFARLMDSFAAGERSLNRAWSAAADRVLPEAIASLDHAIRHLEEAERRLR
jgi:hypothetical protein